MVRSWSGAILLLATSSPAISCGASNAFQCSADTQCNGDAPGALCQPTGYCSFPDDDCPSGQRYGELAGGVLANECVEPTTAGTGSDSGSPPVPPGGTTGDPSTTTNPVVDSSSGPGPGDTTATPPDCGAEGQPCCADVCDGELSCVEGTCEACSFALDIDEYYSCVVRSDGMTWCWGSDDFGQLGDGPVAHQLGAPSPQSLAESFGHVDLGAFHACGVSAKGLSCWGRNDLGQLAQGNVSAPLPSPLPVDLPGADQVSCGSFHCCAHTIDDAVWCWGENDQGQLGAPKSGVYPWPQPVMVGPFAAVSAGARHTCALTLDGLVYCWGLNNDLQLGDDVGVPFGSLVEVAGIPTARALTSGDFHSCIISANDDQVWCWGRNNFEQTGVDTKGGDTLPHVVANLGPASTFDAGDDHTCAVVNGEVSCWGNNSAGQLGNKGIVTSATPLPVSTDGGAVTQVAGGREHTCVVIDDDQIQCFGLNNNGQLGDGSFGTSPLPVMVQLDCTR